MTILMSLRSIYYDAKSTNLTARAIHHYNQEGIMPSIPDTIKSRKKYNFYQVLWLHIIESLREIGYPLKNIKVIKEELIDKPLMKSEDSKLGDLINFSAFEFIVSMAALSDDPSYLIVFKDGKYSFASGNTHPSVQETYLNLPLSALMGKLMDLMSEDSPFRAIKPKHKRMSISKIFEGEWKVKEEGSMNSSDPKKIHIRLNDGRIEVYDDTELEKAYSRLLEVLQNKDYKEITIQKGREHEEE
ncbi:MAG: helix-turn-helix domain-containing protein [Candidatus Thorarchaeota archaeon]